MNEIREQLVDSMQIKPYSSKYKIYIIKDAEKMTEEAQNALLKTIEEPPEYGIVIDYYNRSGEASSDYQVQMYSYATKPVKEKDIHDYLIDNIWIDEEKARFAIEYSEGNLGKAILLATNEEYEQLIKSVIDLETNIFDMDMEDIAEVIQHCSSFRMNINDYLDLMMMWYRDILVLKVTGNPDKILFKEQYLTIRDQSNYLSFNELEAKQKAINSAKERINANANLEDIMRLLILTLKQK